MKNAGQPKFVFLLTWMLIASLAAAPAARAQTDLEQVVESMGESAVNAATKELGFEAGRRLIDLGFQSAPVPAGESSVGTSAVAWVRVGLAVKDFFDAKNDKGRFYASLDVTAAALAISVPVAGAIAAGVIMLAKVIEMGLSAGHAREMLEIAKRIQEYQQKIIQTMRQEAESDGVRLIANFRGMQTEVAAINAIQNDLKEKCGAIGAGTRVELLAECQAKAASLLPRFFNVTIYADRVLNFTSRYLSLDTFFEKQGTSREKFAAGAESLRQSYAESQKHLSALSAFAGEQIARAAVRNAIARGNLSPVAALRNACYASALQFNQQANLALVGGPRRLAEKRARLAELYAEALGSFDAGCTELIVGKDDPLVVQLAQRSLTIEALAEALGQAPAEFAQ